MAKIGDLELKILKRYEICLKNSGLKWVNTILHHGPECKGLEYVQKA